MKVEKREARALIEFRNSHYAGLLRKALERRLETVRDKYELQPSNEQNRSDVVEVREIISYLFDETLEVRQ